MKYEIDGGSNTGINSAFPTPLPEFSYWTLPNDVSENSLLRSALENGWEIYGYFNFASDGRPTRVELRKRSTGEFSHE